MKKILFIATVQSHIINFHIPYIKYFQEKGYTVYVATKMDMIKYMNLMKEDELKDIIWEDVEFSRSPFSIKSIIALEQLIRLMRNVEFELVHVHTPMGGLLGRLATRMTKTGPVLYTAHGFHFYTGAPLINWLIYYPVEKVASYWTDGLITINEEDYIRAKEKLKVRNNKVYKVDGVGIDVNKYKLVEKKDVEFKKSLGLKEADFVVTVIAELIKRKNHIQIIEAMQNLVEKYSNIKLLLVGDGVLVDQLKLEIIKRKLENNVSLLGFRRDIEKIMNITDVVGLFSTQEGLPKNLLEAIAMQKVIICTDIRGNKDLIKDKENGCLIEVGNIEQTEKTIIDLYENKLEIDRFQEVNKKLIKKYSLETILEQMDKIYKEFIVD